MKRIRIFAVIIATMCLGIACNRLEMPDIYQKATEKEAPSKYVPYQAEYVDVPVGKKTLICLGNRVVATCYKSGYVVLPKVKSTKSLAGYEILTVPATGVSGVASENNVEMVVAFEDTKDGDYDYNDLVFQSKLVITNTESGASTVNITLTPVAMGATLHLGLGIVLTDFEGNVLADRMITEDCRTDLFGGDRGIINTMDTRKLYDAIPLTITTDGSSAVTGISWYIISKNERLYAANYFQACVDNANKPQGLVLMNLRSNCYYSEKDGNKHFCGNDFWQYPRECVNINDVYPGFDQLFLDGGDFSILATPSGRYYDAIAAEEDGRLTENCLYDVYENEGGGGSEPSTIGTSYYGLDGNAHNTPQSFHVKYDKVTSNFILEFSTANGNAIDFSRGDYIEGSVSKTYQLFPFVFGDLNPSSRGKTIESYLSGGHNWFRAQDAYDNSPVPGSKGLNSPGSLPYGNGEGTSPIVFRISAAGGLQYIFGDTVEQDVAPDTAIMNYILSLGTDKPFFFGVYGLNWSEADYDYLKIVRVGGETPVDDPVVPDDPEEPEDPEVPVVEGDTIYFDKDGKASDSVKQFTVEADETIKFALPTVNWNSGDYIEFKMDAMNKKGLKLTIGEENPSASGGGACVDLFCETFNMCVYLQGWAATSVVAFYMKDSVVTYQLSKDGFRYKVGEGDWSNYYSAPYDKIKDVSKLFVGQYGFCNETSHESIIYYFKIVRGSESEE